jgi:oligopeptide/dipeptide ABC transporter ATP-binding protein
MALLEVRGLKTYFYLRRGVVRAVDDVSFSVDRGQALGIVGESGSGKSVTALSILGLVSKPGRTIAGSVTLEGVNLLALSEREMRGYRGRHLSMILQDPLNSLNPAFSIGYQVGEGIVVHDRLTGKPLQQRVVGLLDRVGIADAEARVGDYPHQFSGGMRQRIVGAACLACRPHLLIADEATTALDVTTQKQYLNLLQDIQRQEHLALIFITHDFGIVAKMCDRVAVMYAGKIVEKAEVRQIFDHPVHPYTRALMNSVPKVDERVETLHSIEGQPPSLLNLPPGCAFLPRCSQKIEKCSLGESPPEVELPGERSVKCWRYV